MKLVHKVLLPATIIVALSIGNMVHGCVNSETLKGKVISNAIRVVKTAVPVDDSHDKEKFNSAKRKARRNLKNSLDEKVKNGEISLYQAEKEFLEFSENIEKNSLYNNEPEIAIIDKTELDFRENFKSELYNQAQNGKITFEKAEDIYNSFVEMII